jgi:hypothetical protein
VRIEGVAQVPAHTHVSHGLGSRLKIGSPQAAAEGRHQHDGRKKSSHNVIFIMVIGCKDKHKMLKNKKMARKPSAPMAFLHPVSEHETKEPDASSRRARYFTLLNKLTLSDNLNS